MKQKLAYKPTPKAETKKVNISWKDSPQIWRLIVFVIALLLYTNSINSGYNLDDNMVTQKHRLTSKGISAIPKIFKSPYYQDDMGYSYEYRPMVLTSFAIEKSIFGENPKISHFINVLLYSLLCMLLFDVLYRLFIEYSLILPAAVSLLFVVHTIHTEVVCSIKNRDELLAMLFGLLSLKFTLRFVDGNKLAFFLIPLFYLAALLSKVTIMSFAIIIPSTLVLFRKVDFIKFFGIVFMQVTIGHFFITNVGNLNRHLLISFTILFSNIIFYLAFNFNKINLTINKYITYIISIFRSKFVYFIEIKGQEEVENSDFLVFPSQRELVEGLKLPSMIHLIPATLFLLAIGVCYFYFQGFYLFAILLIGVFSFFILPSGFVMWLKLVYSVFCYFVMLHFENASPFIATLFQILLFVSFRIHLKEKGSFLLLVFFLIFSLTDLIIHKEFAFWILLLVGNKYRKYFGYILFILLSYNFLEIVVNTPFDILQYEFILPNLLMIILIFNKSRIKVYVNLFYLVIIGMLYVSIFYINQPLPQKIFTYPNPKKVEVYKNFIPTGNYRELSFIEQPVKASDPLDLKIGTSSVIMLKYLQKVIFPYPLSFYYGYKELEPTPIYNPAAVTGLVVYLFLFLLVGFAFFKDRIFASGLFIYLVSVSIFANFLFPVAGMFAERYLLVPSLGFCIAAISILAKLFKIDLMSKITFSSIKPSIKYGFIGILALYSFLTFSRNFNWKDKITLYRNDIKTVPNSAHAHNILALELMTKSFENGNQNDAPVLRQEAKFHFKKSLAIYPGFFNVWFDLGRVYLVEQNQDSAMFCFKKAAELPNVFAPVYINLAEMYKARKDTVALLDCYKKLMEIDSSNIIHLQSYYYYQFKRGNYREALNTVFKVYRKSPNDIPALITLAETYLKMGKSDSAKYYYKKAYKLNPTEELKKKLND